MAKPDGMYSVVWRTADLAAMLDALQAGRPDYAEAFDVLRVALHIAPEQPAHRLALRKPVRRALAARDVYLVGEVTP